LRNRLPNAFFLFCTIFSFSCHSADNVQNRENSILINKINSLPEFSIKDIFGNTLESKTFDESILYIQYFDPRIITDIKNIKAISDNWVKKGLKIIVVPIIESDNTLLLRNRGIFIIDPFYQRDLKTILQAPTCCESYWIFSTARLLKTGTNSANSENGLSSIFNDIFVNDKSEISRQVILSYNNIFKIPWLFFAKDLIIGKIIDENIIVFMDNICDSCLSGSIIRKINSFNDKNVRTIIILFKNYTNDDIPIIRKQLSISTEIYAYGNMEICGDSNNINSNIINTKNGFNNVIIYYDKKGDILDVFTSECNCFTAFFERIREIE